MIASLLHFDVAPLNLAIRAAVVFLVVLLLLRLAGKRQLGQMGATEFVAILLISNAVQNSMNGGDNSLIGGLWLALILIAISSTISYLTYRSSFFSAVFEGTPTLLVHDGILIKKALNKERISDREFYELLRQQGFKSIHEVDQAILEADGTLSVRRKDHPPERIGHSES